MYDGTMAGDPTMRNLPLAEMLAFAVGAAQAGGQIALRYFQTELRVEAKGDSSPVTIADRECEQYLRGEIARAYPEHGIAGEEFGVARGDAPVRWWLDPIDGTQTFIRGAPLFGVMVGVEQAGLAVLGVVDFPALGETVWAHRGGGAWWQVRGETRRARVSEVARLREATLLYTDARGFAAAGKAEAFERLRAEVQFERTWGDCYGHALVATGRADIMLDPILHAWDACALMPILEEAGGHFVDWQGRVNVHGGSGVSTNARLAADVLRMVR
jgi:histidinol phosphatase-like enzyme (inositol monophosphatase family)